MCSIQCVVKYYKVFASSYKLKKIWKKTYIDNELLIIFSSLGKYKYKNVRSYRYNTYKKKITVLVPTYDSIVQCSTAKIA